jgi:hypothetical protein
MTKRRIGYYVERAARKYFGLPEPEPGDILRRVAARRLAELKAKQAEAQAKAQATST